MKRTLLIFFLAIAFGANAQNALHFDGVDDYVVTSYPGIMGGSTPITVEAWVKSFSGNGEQVIAAWGTESSQGGRFTFRLKNQGGTADVIRIEIKGGGIDGSINVGDSAWHHVAVVYDPSASNKYALYVDGVLDNQGNISTSLNLQPSFNLQIGKRLSPNLSGYFDGEIEEVRVWNVARSLTQLVNDSATEFCQPQTGLVAYHRFNNGTAGGNNPNDTLSIDDSGLGNDGALKNFALTGNTSNWVVGKLTPCVPPTCLSPTSQGATNILGTTADVFWTQSNSGSTFKIEYGTAGFTVGHGTKLSPNNDTITLTGLMPQTSYDVYIKEICSATDSSVSVITSFTTGCGTINTFPYTENFDGLNWTSGTGSYNSGASIDPCWERIPSFASNTYSWGTRTGSTGTGGTGPTTDYSGSGNYIFTECSYGSTGDKANFTTPNFDLSSLNTPLLIFQGHMNGVNTGTLSVWAWNGTSYDTVYSTSGNQGNVWKEHIADLSAYKGITTHLVFHAERGNGFQGDIAIDNVQITEAPPCPKPTVVSYNNVTSNTFDVDFLSSGTSFIIEYGPAGFTQGTGMIDTATATGHTVSGLTPNTAYDFYIQNNCAATGDGTSVWVGPVTLHTLCSFTSAYFTDWENLSNNDEDPCWSYYQFGGTSGYAKAIDPATSSQLQPFSGDIYYRMYNSSSSELYLVSPEISDLSTNTLQVRFQFSDTYTGTNGNGHLIVGTASSLTDSSTIVEVDTVYSTTNNWTEFTVVLSNVPANHKYIVFRHGSNSNYVSLTLDDIYVEAQPACIPPSNGVFSNVADTSAIVSWDAGDGNTWEIEYGPTGFTQGTGTLVTGLTFTTDTLTGLSAQSCYDVYIRGNCTSNSSQWYGPITVCTQCAVAIAPFSENFDGSNWTPGSTSSNIIDDCWERNPDANFTFRWETGTGSTTSSNTGPGGDVSGSGNYVYAETSSGANGSDAFLTTPMIDLSNLTTPIVKFDYHMYGSTINALYVRVNNGSSYDTIYTIVGQQQNGSSEPWLTAYVSLAGYTSTPKAIQFVAKKGTSYTGDIAIDEVFVGEMPTCLLPTNFALDTVSSSTGVFSWNSISNGTNFKFEYGPAGFVQGSGVAQIAYGTGSPDTITGLMPNTTYDIYLADMCDSTNWVGPITFTTLIDDDAELKNLISPSSLSCGDSALVVEVEVMNNGLNPINSVTVGANISGAVSANISTVYTTTIAPGASATVTVGTINSYMGGMLDVESYASLAGDQELSNDTLLTNNVEIIAAVPLHMPVDTLCAGDTTGLFVAVPQTGIINNWYNNMADITPFAMGDTISATPGQTVYLDRSKEVDQTVIDAQNTSSQFGNMFKLYIKENILFTGFSFEAATSGAGEPIAFYKSGNFVGHETSPADWTPIDSMSMTVVSNGWYRLNFATPVQFTAGDTVSLYLANKQGTKMRWENLTSLNAVGDLYLNNADFEYYAGVTGAYFGNNMTSGGPRAVSSIIHYSSNDVCGNNRVALTMGVNNDTAMASFTHNINTNGADVDFDASASTGQVFEWNFGDGNTGTGIMPMHTYASGGNYTVTLIVTDTVCGTADTISDIVMPFVSIEESLLSRSLNVYPNPNSGNFKVSFEVSGIQNVEMAVVNTVGKVVYQEKMGAVAGTFNQEIAIDNLAPGIYFLRIIANGKPTVVKMTIL